MDKSLLDVVSRGLRAQPAAPRAFGDLRRAALPAPARASLALEALSSNHPTHAPALRSPSHRIAIFDVVPSRRVVEELSTPEGAAVLVAAEEEEFKITDVVTQSDVACFLAHFADRLGPLGAKPLADLLELGPAEVVTVPCGMPAIAAFALLQNVGARCGRGLFAGRQGLLPASGRSRQKLLPVLSRSLLAGARLRIPHRIAAAQAWSSTRAAPSSGASRSRTSARLPRRARPLALPLTSSPLQSLPPPSANIPARPPPPAPPPRSPRTSTP